MQRDLILLINGVTRNRVEERTQTIKEMEKVETERKFEEKTIRLGRLDHYRSLAEKQLPMKPLFS